MKRILLTPLLLCTICSCAFDANGDPHLTTTGWIIITLVIILFIYIAIVGSKENAKQWKKLNKEGIKQSDMNIIGTYVGGHPDADKTLSDVVVYKYGEELRFATQVATAPPENKFTISIESIKNIGVEDSSTMQKRVTLGRVLLVGVFALAWRKNKKTGYAFITVDWNDGKFDHSTIFSFEGKDAMQKANTARNKLIKLIR